jgi:hypothetical protein
MSTALSKEYFRIKEELKKDLISFSKPNSELNDTSTKSQLKSKVKFGLEIT